MWNLFDYSSYQYDPGHGSFISAKYQIEFNCMAGAGRILHIITYANNMGDGKIISVQNVASRWEEVTPKTFSETSFENACKALKR
jgi:hypothetical protein